MTSSLAFSQGLDYVIQQLVQFANSLRWLGYVCTPVKGGPAASGMPAPGAQTLWHVEALSDVVVSFEMLCCHMNYECISHNTHNTQSQSTFRNTPKAEIPGVAGCAGVESLLLQPQPQQCCLHYPKVIMAPNANKKKAGTKAKVSTSKVQASLMSTSKTFFILNTIPAVHMAFSPHVWVDLPLYAWEIGMQYLAVFCHHIGVPLTTIWWHDKHSGYMLETECNDVMSKIGFYSIKDMTRDGLDMSTSFALVHILLSTFTSEADTISASFDKAPAMFCNGSSPTKDVMLSQTVLYADALRNFPEGVYVPSPLPPYFDHPFLPHKWYVMPSSLFIAPPVSSTIGSSATGSSAAGSSAAGSSAAGSSAAGSSAASSSATGSSAIGVKCTLPLLLRFTKRQRTEGVVAEGGDVMMDDGGDVSVPTVDGDRDVVMQDGASVAATTPSSGAATCSSHVRFLLGHPILGTRWMWIGLSKKRLL
ncbi:hypothetical protein BS47DRAFT_1426619 [Hydnum rufescens UP504]|uniref:Uncharacterized protein n=1 Tax=Hydnum rufescens UP504 TaxID=1448309 RepID=A0A9P6DZR7_9AGAM|nr:hypothetical protein BS47DRAFT_1426619 [Hydnum rufescens UP504]